MECVQVASFAITWDHILGGRVLMPSLSDPDFSLQTDCGDIFHKLVTESNSLLDHPDGVPVHQYQNILQEWSEVRARLGYSHHPGSQVGQRSPSI